MDVQVFEIFLLLYASSELCCSDFTLADIRYCQVTVNVRAHWYRGDNSKISNKLSVCVSAWCSLTEISSLNTTTIGTVLWSIDPYDRVASKLRNSCLRPINLSFNYHLFVFTLLRVTLHRVEDQIGPYHISFTVDDKPDQGLTILPDFVTTVDWIKNKLTKMATLLDFLGYESKISHL